MSDNPSIYIPPELLARVDHQAAELGRSRSWLVRHALEVFLDPVDERRAMPPVNAREVIDAIERGAELRVESGSTQPKPPPRPPTRQELAWEHQQRLNEARERNRRQ